MFESLITFQAPSTEPQITSWNALQMKYILDDVLEDIRAQNGPSHYLEDSAPKISPAELYQMDKALNEEYPPLDATTVARLSDQMDESMVPKTRNGAAYRAAYRAGYRACPAAAAAAVVAGAVGLTGATMIGAPIAADLIKHGLPHWYQFIDNGTDIANGVIGHGTDFAHEFLTGIDNLADDFVSGW